MVDIIVRAKDGHDLTRECVDSIRERTDYPYRLILVDDGSDPPLDVTPDVLVRHATPRGAVSATNAGLAVSLQYDDSAYVCIMDNDTEVPEGDSGWLGRMVKELEQHPDTAAVGATSDYVNMPQHVLTAPITYTADWDNGAKDNPPVVWFVSFCCLLRKSAVRHIGLWDERYNPGQFEDTDYAMQLRVADYRVRVARSVYIHHKGSQTFGSRMRELWQANRSKFLKKWGAGRAWDMGMLNSEELKWLADRTQNG